MAISNAELGKHSACESRFPFGRRKSVVSTAFHELQSGITDWKDFFEDPSIPNSRKVGVENHLRGLLAFDQLAQDGIVVSNSTEPKLPQRSVPAYSILNRRT